MEESNIVFKIIINECCRSLFYDNEKRQFLFPLHVGQNEIWERLKVRLNNVSPTFFVNDYNKLLGMLECLQEQYEEKRFFENADKNILPGEIIKINMQNCTNKTITLIKMKDGQYLDLSTGQGFSLGSSFIFVDGCAVDTSEGEHLGFCSDASFLIPNQLHIALSGCFLGNYYRRRIGDSLWPLFNKAKNICLCEQSCYCYDLLSTATELGINTLVLLSIINAATKV